MTSLLWEMKQFILWMEQDKEALSQNLPEDAVSKRMLLSKQNIGNTWRKQCKPCFYFRSSSGPRMQQHSVLLHKGTNTTALQSVIPTAIPNLLMPITCIKLGPLGTNWPPCHLSTPNRDSIQQSEGKVRKFRLNAGVSTGSNVAPARMWSSLRMYESGCVHPSTRKFHWDFLKASRIVWVSALEMLGGSGIPAQLWTQPMGCLERGMCSPSAVSPPLCTAPPPPHFGAVRWQGRSSRLKPFAYPKGKPPHLHHPPTPTELHQGLPPYTQNGRTTSVPRGKAKH